MTMQIAARAEELLKALSYVEVMREVFQVRSIYLLFVMVSKFTSTAGK